MAKRRRKKRQQGKERGINSEVARFHASRFIVANPGFRTEGCILCNKPVVFMGLFFPPEGLAKVLGEPKGKTRSFAYGLCEDCAALKDNCQMVEDEILGRLMTEV